MPLSLSFDLGYWKAAKNFNRALSNIQLILLIIQSFGDLDVDRIILK
jgi:hypothetical protein